MIINHFHKNIKCGNNPNKQINSINKEDMVLLFHNQNRIIAVGFVIKEFTGHDYQRDMGSVDKHWADVNWIWKATFDNQLKPTNSIIRTNLDITMVGKTVVNITDQLDYRRLLEEISKRQIYM